MVHQNYKGIKAFICKSCEISVLLTALQEPRISVPVDQSPCEKLEPFSTKENLLMRTVSNVFCCFIRHGGPDFGKRYSCFDFLNIISVL